MDQELVQITREKTIQADKLRWTLYAMHEEIWRKLGIPQLDSENLPHRVEENVVTPEWMPVPDCQTCGACCGGFVAVPTEPDDDVPEEECWEIVAGEEGEEYVVDRYIRRRESDLACKHLWGGVGGKVTCKIYDDRPNMCRVFEAGSDRCHALRRAFGLEPYLSVEDMFAARQRLKEHVEAKGAESDKIKSVSITPDEAGMMKVEVVTKGGESKLVHTFDPAEETWYRVQFEGKTLGEAEKMILS
ncbi:MAG: YkgJ family cysteine cluster protein [Acidobacteriota bacterium]|nr:MAG: YkgJ family cysteine cluster protein [Acidobacteriota bacterium]